MQVASYVSNLDKDLTDRRKTSEFDMQGLLLETYASMVAADLGKRLKKAPSVAFYPADKTPKGLFEGNLPGWQVGAAPAVS